MKKDVTPTNTMIDKIVQEFEEMLKIVATDEDEDMTEEYRAQWLRTTLSTLISKQIEAIEKSKKWHKEFECSGAHDGKGCYEAFCEDQNCRNAPKEYNAGLDTAITILNTFK